MKEEKKEQVKKIYVMGTEHYLMKTMCAGEAKISTKCDVGKRKRKTNRRTRERKTAGTLKQ